MKRMFFVLFALALFLVAAPGAKADVLDIFDNAAAPPGTFVLLGYFGFQHYPEVDVDGTTVNIPKLNISYAALRPIYYFPKKLFGKMTWGCNLILPFSHVSQDGEINSTGLGDITVGPFIYLYENCHSNVYLSFWEFIYTPTGKYDENRVLNNGSDSWWFEHQIAFGWYPGKIGVDSNFNYWMKQESDKLDIDYQDAVEFEGALHYGLTEKFRLAVHWDFWWDLDNLEIGGQEVSNTKEKIYRVGGSLAYYATEKISFNFRYMYDVEAENALKGHWAYFRVAYAF
jgi:hypothetical protein